MIFFLLPLIFLVGCYPTRESLEWDRAEQGPEDLVWLEACPPDLSHPLTLDEMIDLALVKNLELFVQAQKIAIQEDQAERVRWQLLPDMDFNYLDSRRSQNTASFSRFLNPLLNIGPPIYQIGAPQHHTSWNIGLAWNALDFGITYFRARQQENKATQEEFEYNRVRNSLVLRIVSAYWRAVFAKLAIQRMNELLPDMLDQTEKLNRELVDKAYLSKAQGLAKLVYFYQREIQVRGYNDRNDSSDPTQGYEKEFESNLLDLATLMQLPPGVDFDIALPEGDLGLDAHLPDLGSLFDLALQYRPELYQKDLDILISKDDVTIAMIQQFPAFRAFNINNFDSNPFLLHHHWYDAGFSVAWNLLDFPSNMMGHVVATDSVLVAYKSRLQISQGVLSQVALARIQFMQNKEQFEIALKVYNASRAVAELAELESRAGKKSKLEALQSKIDTALALNNVQKIYAELQSNLEQINNSIGLPRYFQTTSVRGVENDPSNNPMFHIDDCECVGD
jgi:multidrug efflux system outer membrane protein